MNLVRISENTVINADRIDGLVQLGGEVNVYVGGAATPFNIDGYIENVMEKIQSGEQE